MGFPWGSKGPHSLVTRLKGSGSSWEVRTAPWQNLNAKATGGGGVINKVAKEPQGKGEQECGPSPPTDVLCPQAVELTAFEASGRAPTSGGSPFPLGAQTPLPLTVPEYLKVTGTQPHLTSHN